MGSFPAGSWLQINVNWACYVLSTDLYAIIKTTEKLERAYVRDAISPELYEQACERLIAQFKVLWGSLKNAVSLCYAGLCRGGACLPFMHGTPSLAHCAPGCCIADTFMLMLLVWSCL